MCAKTMNNTSMPEVPRSASDGVGIIASERVGDGAGLGLFELDGVKCRHNEVEGMVFRVGDGKTA